MASSSVDNLQNHPSRMSPTTLVNGSQNPISVQERTFQFISYFMNEPSVRLDAAGESHDKRPSVVDNQNSEPPSAIRRTQRNFPSQKKYSSLAERNAVLSGRIIRRKKRRFKSLLHDLTKELTTSYLCEIIKSTKEDNILDRLVIEAENIVLRPSSKFLNFARGRLGFNTHNEQQIPAPELRDLLRISEDPLPVASGNNIVSTTIPSVTEAQLTPGQRGSNEKKSVATINKLTETNHTKKKDSPLEQAFRLVAGGDGDLSKKKTPPKPPKKYSEKMKAEASIMQRIGELQKEGMWYDKRLPKVKEPDRCKTHWDYVLEEAMWMNMDFQQERKWKQMAARKISKAIRRHFTQKELAAQRALKEEEIKRRRVASFMAREIQKFWGNVKKVLELREQSRIEELKKKALDQQLSFIVDQTEKYSGLLAEKFQSMLKKDSTGDGSASVSELESITGKASDAEFEPKSASEDDEETIAKADEEVKTADIKIEIKMLKKESKMELDDVLDELPPGYLEARLREIETEKNPSAPTASLGESSTGGSNNDPTPVDDDEFVAPSDSESDYENTIDEQEEKEVQEGANHEEEIKELNAENELSIEELRAKYASYPGLSGVPEDGMDVDHQESSEESITTSEGENNDDDEDDDEDASEAESGMESAEEEDEEYETADFLQEDENENGLASLLKTFAPERASEVDDDAALNSVAALAESFQPKGYTLSSTTVVTKIPPLIKHTLREYQHIGVDWLVTMYEKKLNGILADEMGLGKTIQTISLLAHLAYEKANWGPHLIVVPTSVMLNWEMEFKKWCPGFKILTYYGSQKERKLKRTGWTKPNSFHICITSYKLVIQDHQSFRRKRWKYLILDEAQNIKNFKSQRWQLLLNFNAQRRLLLTGTPLQNNLMELWSLMHFLMPNVFQSHREFREWFSNPVTGMVEGSAEYNENIIRRLHKVLRPFILRRLKSEVEKQLPKKYEHLIMCRLSKRQRFLYEEFMSRTRTKETLNAGNLLSVINVLMQLRKVCNHPNLFEPRPVISPLQAEGINYVIPSIVWNMIDDIIDLQPSYPIFRMTEDDLQFSKEEAWRIKTLGPDMLIQDYKNKEDEISNGRMIHNSNHPAFTLKNKSEIKIFKDTSSAPPAKRQKIDFSDIVLRTPPPPMPRLTAPIPFFLTTVDPNAAGLFDDPDFVDYVSKRPPCSPRKNPLIHQPSPLLNGDIQLIKPKTDNGGSQQLVVVKPNSVVSSSTPSKVIEPESFQKETDDDEDEFNSESEESDAEVVESYKKRKIPIICKKTGADGVAALGLNPVEFELPEIQSRSINNKKAVLKKLQKLNYFRCEKNPVYGQSVLEKFEIFAPTYEGLGRRLRYTHKCRKSPFLIRRDFHTSGYFNLGFGEVERVVRTKLHHSRPCLRNHPDLLSDPTKCLQNMILTLEERIDALQSVLSRYVIYIPAVAAPLPQCKIFKPSPSRYCKQLYLEKEMKNGLRQPSEILYPIITSMSTQFPDPRLIQYDCGKLQMLDRLLRQLKAGSHRVLIFTQMARMLDVLEAFLNYHGHIYLRLDGATRIDQRQILMERFNTDKRIFCFILSTRSGGIGVNLTGADTVIFYDSDWNPTMDAQAQDRCHRIGQTRDVHIYRLLSEKTVEENILKKSNQKRMLGEIAIEGGSFTTAYFTKNTIHDLFDVDQLENDPKKRLAELTASTLNAETISFNDENKMEVVENKLTPLVIKPLAASTNADETQPGAADERGAIQMLECALLAAEDETDVQAARTVRAEAAAELAEFDENISLDELDNQTAVVEDLPKSEIEEIFDQLNPVELYAVRLMEHCLEDWTTETYANAEKDLEKQKQEWEEAQHRHLQELEKDEVDDEDSDEDEDILTYVSLDSKNQVKGKSSKNQEEVKGLTTKVESIRRGRGRPPKNKCTYVA